MLCIVGGGKMGQALASGILEDPDHEDVAIVERGVERRAELEQWIAASEFKRVTVTETLARSDGAIVAVKPHDVEIAVGDVVSVGTHRVMSVAAGVTLSRLHEWAGHGVPLIRAMPNIGALVGKGATAIAGGSTAHEEDLIWAEAILRKTGTVVRVQESQMDAVTGLSGSGPAYFFLIIEAMIDAGVHAGLPRDVSEQLTVSTLQGAAELASSKRPGMSAAELRAMVTTPGGTTAAGLRVLEQRAVRAALVDAVDAATRRSHELGSSGIR